MALCSHYRNFILFSLHSPSFWFCFCFHLVMFFKKLSTPSLWFCPFFSSLSTFSLWFYFLKMTSTHGGGFYCEDSFPMTFVFFFTHFSWFPSFFSSLPIPCVFHHENWRPTHFLNLINLEENEIIKDERDLFLFKKIKTLRKFPKNICTHNLKTLDLALPWN